METKITTLSLTNFECAQIYVLIYFHLYGGKPPTEDPMILRTLELIFQDLLINTFSDPVKEVKVD